MSETSLLPCPFLPVPPREMTADDMHSLGKDRSAVFYDRALNYAQTLWLTGFPAKSLLLINRALACHLPETSLAAPWKPYHAVAWILRNRPADGFVGNPRRHYQHLATRMVEPHKELRTWRAWACWYMAKTILNEKEFPSDAKQIREELIVEPKRADIVENLGRLSPRDDVSAWEVALLWNALESKITVATSRNVHFQIISADLLPIVQQLALMIWPSTYSDIISVEQIHYMLDKMYDLQTMASQIKDKGATFALILMEDEAIGFLAWDKADENGIIFLQKLYLLPKLHGQGIGAQALQWLESQQTSPNVRHFRLRVNKNNHAAIRAYLRQGFVFEEDVCTEIGDEFVMDDHLMIKGLR